MGLVDPGPTIGSLRLNSKLVYFWHTLAYSRTAGGSLDLPGSCGGPKPLWYLPVDPGVTGRPCDPMVEPRSQSGAVGDPG